MVDEFGALRRFAARPIASSQIIEADMTRISGEARSREAGARAKRAAPAELSTAGDAAEVDLDRLTLLQRSNLAKLRERAMQLIERLDTIANGEKKPAADKKAGTADNKLISKDEKPATDVNKLGTEGKKLNAADDGDRLLAKSDGVIDGFNTLAQLVIRIIDKERQSFGLADDSSPPIRHDEQGLERRIADELDRIAARGGAQGDVGADRPES
jgi:hypothetical protein